MFARPALRGLAARGLARVADSSPRVFGIRWATYQANELRVGNIVQKAGQLLEVTKHSYTQGQARASGNVQVEYRDLRTGGKLQARLSPSDKVERAALDAEVRPVVRSERNGIPPTPNLKRPHPRRTRGVRTLHPANVRPSNVTDPDHLRSKLTDRPGGWGAVAGVRLPVHGRRERGGDAPDDV